MAIEGFASEFRGLVDEEAVISKLCTGFTFTEGPIWNPLEQALYFSDMPGDVRRPANKFNDMTYDAAGNLYVCEHATSKLIMETPAGARKVVASHWHGQELNSPNDVVLRSDRSIYFSDPIYGRALAVVRGGHVRQDAAIRPGRAGGWENDAIANLGIANPPLREQLGIIR